MNYNFSISVNMLNIRSRGFDRAQYCITCYIMLIKFSKHIVDTFAKIIEATKANSKPCQTSEMELFVQVVTCFRSELRILPNI